MKNSIRETVRKMFGGHCAYCGGKLGKRWHVDHVEPILRGRDNHGGSDAVKNMFPSCPRCNTWKATFSVEQFREEITNQVERARRYSRNFRLAEDFGLIKETNSEVVFCFEQIKSDVNK